MAVDANALTSLATVKSHLNIGVLITNQDTKLERLINASSAKIENFLDRKILTRSYTEYQDGRRADRIILKQWPIEKPSELWDDPSGLFTDVSTQIDSADFDIENDGDAGLVQLLNGLRFGRGSRNIKAVYNAGFATVPYDVEEACIMTVEFLYDLAQDRRIGVSSKGKNNESTSFLSDLPDIVQNMLVPYQRSEFGLASIAVQNG
jgi:hypothetical protein